MVRPIASGTTRGRSVEPGAEVPKLAVEIFYYGVATPISIPIIGSDRAAAESYFERLKRDVIAAQQHSQRQLLIRPFDRTQEAQVVQPWEIQRVLLVDHPQTSEAADEVPVTSPQPPAADNRAAAVQDRPPRLHSPIPRGRTKRLALAGLSVALVVGLSAVLIDAADGEGPAGPVAVSPTQSTEQSTEPSGLPPLPATAKAPNEQLLATISALSTLATRDPDVVGPEADQVLARLQQVQMLEGGPRRSAAVVANASVGVAVAAGEFDADVGQQVQEVLDNVARPPRLIDLVQLVGADPVAIGPGGPGLLDPLVALDHQVPADQTAASAATLLETVTSGTENGQLSEAFQTAAVATLQDLADPAAYLALQDLLADVERDPSSIGPAGHHVLGSLRDIAQLPVFPQGNLASELLGLVLQEGQVTTVFRDAAIPVLVPLVR
ncbi:MAG: hypothetical protein H0T99_13065 [Geodermatophilaceae bacterium]|nr:hypothetical protein [Geodermatophilaceae bacterium]